MQSGDLKHKILIQQNTSDGTTDPNWQTFCIVWAAKQMAAGRLFYQAAAAQSENDVVFTIRYRAGIKPEMQIVADGDAANPYRIISEPININDNRQWLEIHARRVDQNGGV